MNIGVKKGFNTEVLVIGGRYGSGTCNNGKLHTKKP